MAVHPPNFAVNTLLVSRNLPDIKYPSTSAPFPMTDWFNHNSMTYLRIVKVRVGVGIRDPTKFDTNPALCILVKEDSSAEE